MSVHAEPQPRDAVERPPIVLRRPGDGHEHETDRIAQDPTAARQGIARLGGSADDRAEPAPASVGRVLAGPGTPLAPGVRDGFERFFGHDFSAVRVHSGTSAAQSARDVDARAYTVGTHVVFGTGEFAPDDPTGRQVIAHELAHVVQQGGGPYSGQPAAVQRLSFSDVLETGGEIVAGPSGGDLVPAHGIIQRKCACGNTAMAGDECEQCGKNKQLGLQAKLKVNEPGDVYEQEADRVANQIMTAPAHSAVSSAQPTIQRFSGQSSGGDAASASVGKVLSGPGRQLEPALREDMEQRFGCDFSSVRVHSDAAAEQSARDVNAHAYTVGHNIVFGLGAFAPGTREGQRLIAHELTHVVQQSTGQITEAVQREPNKDDWSSFESTYGGDPRFVFWAKRHGKPPATYGEFVALLDGYHKAMEMNPKDVLEEYDRAQLEKDRSELEKRRQTARAAEDRTAEAKPKLGQKRQEEARRQNRVPLYRGICEAWRERRKHAGLELINQAESLVAHGVPLANALLHGLHWKSEQQRWVFIYYYYREYVKLHPESSVDEEELLHYAVLAEENYLETNANEAEASELARYRKGVTKIARTEQIKKLAATRPMNLLGDFEPGIHDYAPYSGQPQSVDVDIVNGDFDEKNLTINYSDGKELDIPLNDNLLFPNTPLDSKKVLRIFTRRHKKSQRLIPFVIYENALGVDLDVLPEEELALMGLPRFDPLLTPVIMYFLSPEFKMQKLSLATLKIASLHAANLGLRQLGVPLASRTLGTGSAIVTSTVRTGTALATAAARHVSVAVTTSASVGEAVTYLGRTAWTYYLVNAVEINTLGLLGTDIAINLGGEDTGGVSLGDEMSMVVAEAKTTARGVKEWKLIEAEVEEVNLASKQVRSRITRVINTEEKTAKAEYDLGKRLTLVRKSTRKGNAKAAAVKPAAATETLALEPVSGDHAVKVTREGITICSPDPCPLVRSVYKKELTPALEERLQHAENNRLVDPRGAAAEAADVREEMEVARRYSSGGIARDRRTVTQYQRDLARRGLWGESRIGTIAKRKLARDIEKVLPPTSSVELVAVEGSEAGLAQGRAAERKGTIVNLEVEPRIDLPDAVRKKAGLYVPGPGESRIKGSFKPDDIEFLGGDSYRFKDHKEVEAIWGESFYSSDKARDKLREMLFRDLEIARALQPNCKGFTFTTNSKELKLLLAELIVNLPREARALLHAP